MDQLVGLSDDLGKLDTYVEGVCRKLAQYLGEVLEDARDKLQENLLANNSKCYVFQCALPHFLVFVCSLLTFDEMPQTLRPIFFIHQIFIPELKILEDSKN